MPIRRDMRSRYPVNWREISLARRQAAGWRCEWCEAHDGKPHPQTGGLVVLSCAHLDQQPENNDPGNLAALCQRCHLAHDLPFNVVRRRLGRRQGDLFPYHGKGSTSGL